MKKYTLFFALVLNTSVLQAQDIALFSQKLTNSFIYNPSLAGLTTGTFMYSYRRNYSAVQGAPEDHYVSIHSPISNYRYGVGLNAYQENVSFMSNTFVSTAFAMHFRIDQSSTLSVGISGELTTSRVSANSNTSINGVDPVILALQNGVQKFDVSAGANYANRHLNIGIALNKLNSSWINAETPSLANYFTGYAQGMIPARAHRDSFEPYFSYRKLSATYYTWDVGAFYMVNNSIIAGLALRRGNIVSTTIAFRFPKKIMIGYSREMIGNSLGGLVGSTNEIVLRFDFTPSRRSPISECNVGDPYGVQINSRYRKVFNNPPAKSRKGNRTSGSYNRKKQTR